MNLPVNIDDYMKYMPLNEDELQELHISAIVKARVERLRGCYAFWLRYPRFTVREMVDQDKAMFGVSETQAYDDIHLCQVMLGNLNAASKEFWRWKVNQEIDEDRKAAKAAGDFRALAVMQKNRIKNNRTDTPDEPELAFDKIVPVEFRMTDDPTVIGLQKIPNLRAKIKKMEKRYSMPDIEDADFEELPPDDDSSKT